MTVFEHLDAAAVVREKQREKEAEEYHRDRRNRARILDEHAAFLEALTTIDILLDKMQHVTTFEGLMELASQMDDAMPESIVVARKGNPHA